MALLIRTGRHRLHGLHRLAPLALAGLLALCASAATAPPAAAQTVVGAVTDESTAQPLEGVFVVLVDDAGRRRNGVLSGPDGAFVIRAPAPGRYRLVAELIGYGSTTTPPLDVPAGPAVRHDIGVRVQAVTLEGIQVEAGERCRRGPGSGAETARLWEEARKALEVARWSGERGVLRFLVVSHTREVDARTLRVTSQQEKARRGYHDRSPYRSIPADLLHEHGYIREAADGTWNYFAPDAEVLLSEGFLDTHCFRVVAPTRDADDAGLIGLGFEPVPERTLPDVAGVLWLERGTAELRRLDYTYQNFPFRHGDWSKVGGRVEFERLATGIWIVRRWHIRMPLTARETGGPGARRLELRTLSEQGAEVREVTTAGGRVLADAIQATLHGTITRRSDGAGIAGAVVEIPRLDRRTTTGPDGVFRLTGLPGGSFDVRVSHPAFQRPADAAREQLVELRPGAATRYLLDLERRPVSAPTPVAAQDGPTWSNGIVGRVIAAPSRRPVSDAIARLLGRDGAELGTMVTDDLGRFRLLHPGRGSDYVLEVRHPEYGEFRQEVRLETGEELDLQVVLQRR